MEEMGRGAQPGIVLTKNGSGAVGWCCCAVEDGAVMGVEEGTARSRASRWSSTGSSRGERRGGEPGPGAEGVVAEGSGGDGRRLGRRGGGAVVRRLRR
jgi:hypothetical protein